MPPKHSSRSTAQAAQLKAINEKKAIADGTTNSSASSAANTVPDGSSVPEDTARIQML